MSVALGAVWMLAAGTAEADEGVCKESYEQSQLLMKPNSGKSTLIPAREMLRTCMRSGCKDWVVADCSRWLAEVEARIPTVVFSARNTAGRDLTEIVVRTPEDEPLVSRLDGRMMEIEPGEQVFVFVAPDGTRREKRVLVREGEKSQSVAAIFDAPPEELQPAPPPASAGSDRTVAPSAERSPSSLRYVGYGLTGLGVVGVGIGAAFGISAIANKNEANCDESSKACDRVPLADARSAATVSSVAFVAGGVLAAGGIALVLLTPAAVRIDARAALAPGSGMFGVGGRW